MATEISRLDLAGFEHLAPETARALRAISAATKQSALGAELIELVKLRASLVNRCPFCVAMHRREARRLGISGERLEALARWRESPHFAPRERAALAWTDALTQLSDGDVPDEVHREVSAAFSGADLAALTSVVATINAWNRIAMAYRFPAAPDEGGGA
ncbi:alkylhydroperoxidase [Sorangium cellulosum]|uniref:Alkylhydroperoxidase n=1 Tax=Sorangium cellulosum TaxID=56 RepID=A0A2L0EMH5_SORCE|nr:carboxymuconolactone decarboxylase family protein [Sorangium cellulosum]AUX40462.1 alkylhydroperoxidase [Sorangium cellulosum]